MAIPQSNGARRRPPTMGKHERAAVVARLEQIANELTFPGLTLRQAKALETERFTLTGMLANDSQAEASDPLEMRPRGGPEIAVCNKPSANPASA